MASHRRRSHAAARDAAILQAAYDTETEPLAPAIAPNPTPSVAPQAVAPLTWWLWFWYWITFQSLPLEPWGPRPAIDPRDPYANENWNRLAGCTGTNLVLIFAWLVFLLTVMFVCYYIPSSSDYDRVLRTAPSITSFGAPGPEIEIVQPLVRPGPVIPLPVAPPVSFQAATLPASTVPLGLILCSSDVDCQSGQRYALPADLAFVPTLRVLASLCAARCTAPTDTVMAIQVPVGLRACVCMETPRQRLA